MAEVEQVGGVANDDAVSPFTKPEYEGVTAAGVATVGHRLRRCRDHERGRTNDHFPGYVANGVVGINRTRAAARIGTDRT